MSTQRPVARALFICPPAKMVREDRCQQPIENLVVTPLLPPTDLMLMAAVAEASGCACKIKDYRVEDASPAAMERDLREFAPDYVIVNVGTPTLDEDLAVLQRAKAINPSVTTIAKGAPFLRLSKETIEKYPSVDLVIRGEPELTLQEALQGRSPAEIAGLAWRNASGAAVINADRPFNAKLDLLPNPARHLVDNNQYRRPDNGRVLGVVHVSRGCPYDCFFCLATALAGARVRARSPQKILDELRECVERYQIKNFLFWSDNFNSDREWTRTLCREIIASGLKVKWASNTRADLADKETAELMFQAGCRLVSVGVESGNEEILKRIGKRIRPDQARAAARVLKQAGIQTYNYFVIGLPWDTEETVEDTIRLALELDGDFTTFFTAVPFLGARFYDYALAEGLMEPSSPGGYEKAYFQPVVRGHHLTKERIFELHKSAVRRFYMRPSYVFKRLRRIRSLKEFVSHARAALSIVGMTGK